MTARRREDRPSSWEEIVASLWQALDEARPVARELAERRAELSPFGDVPPPEAVHDTNGANAPFPEAGAPRGEGTPSLEPAARLLSRELFLGRVVLFFGVAAFVGALAFALHVVVSAPEPPPSRAGPSPGFPPRRPLPEAPRAAAPPGGSSPRSSLEGSSRTSSTPPGGGSPARSRSRRSSTSPRGAIARASPTRRAAAR